MSDDTDAFAEQFDRMQRMLTELVERMEVGRLTADELQAETDRLKVELEEFRKPVAERCKSRQAD